MSFFDIAKPMAERGVPQIRLGPRTKVAVDDNWPNLASIDLEILQKLSFETPDANAGSVAKAELGGVWFFDADSPEVAQRVFADTQQRLPDTFKVRSSVGKCHVYFRQSPASLAMGNISQDIVKEGDWSARVNNQYVVSPGSLHPKSGLPYEIRSLAPIIEAPDWFINWCISQKLEKKTTLVPKDEEPILEGGRNAALTSIAGSLRNKGLVYEEILSVLSRINSERCQPPLPQNEIDIISRSVSRYEIGKPNVVLVGGKVAGAEQQTSSVISVSDEETIKIEPVPYPKFPEWVMHGTSIYDGLCEPFCRENSRYPSFMWLPAMTILLNYLGTKVGIERKNLIPSIFMVSIGRRGKVIKSSSAEDAMRYFEYAGVLGHSDSKLNNANARSLVFTPASPEGLGKEMQRMNCRNGILFFDELKTLVNKAAIESSTLQSTLLTIYESGKYQNLTKNSKDSFSFAPGSYCASLIACSTDKNFTMNWGKLAGNSTGLDDRFFFLLQPETLKPLTPYVHVNPVEGSQKTRQFIEKALQKGVYSIVDSSPLSKFTSENDDSNRAEIRAEKFALGLAIDMGLDEIDEDCIERSLALIEYERAVKKYLRTYESQTREASIQQELLYTLRKAGGVLSLREIHRILHPERMGTSLWSASYLGMIKANWVKEIGTGVKGDEKKVVLLRVPEDDD